MSGNSRKVVNGNARQVLHEAARRDFYTCFQLCFAVLHGASPLIPSPAYELIAAYLVDVMEGRVRRLIINLPPRSLKSEITSVAFSAFWLGHHPDAHIICASYGQDLAEKFSRDTLAVMQGAAYQGVFPGTQLSRTKRSMNEFTTIQGGSRLATSVGGVLTGRGADLILIDDPIKPDDAVSDARRGTVNQWFDNSVLSRLNDKTTGAIVVIMQRVHEDDLTGHLLEKGGWKLLSLPAIAECPEHYSFQTAFGVRHFNRNEGEALFPQREPLPVLAEMRQSMGEFDFAGQYQQSPAPRDGGMVKRSWIRHYAPQERPASFDRVVQSWDTATKPTELSDYSVCTTWGVAGKDLYLLHVLRKKLGYPDLKRAVREQAELHGASVILIEDKSSGTQLIQELVEEGMHAIQRCTPLGDKAMRLNAQTAKFENGFVYVPQAADWLEIYLHEITTFPKGRHDDQVDSTSQALEWLQTGQSFGGLIEYYKQEYAGAQEGLRKASTESFLWPPDPLQR